MKFIRNGLLEQEFYDRLQREYWHEKPVGHLTELLYCLTRSWYDRYDPLEITDREKMLFSIGFGLERVFLRDPGDGEPVSEVVDGVSMTEDYISLTSDEGVDLKTTRMYATLDGTPKMGWPENWLKQFMAYARKRGQLTYNVAIVYLGMPALVCGTFVWTQEELDANWSYILNRSVIYNSYAGTDLVPPPFTFNASWECETKTSKCRYLERCRAVERGMK